MGAERIRVVSAEIERNGHYLLTQRRADAVLPLLWEFPGGRVREGESDAEALVRCLEERTGLRVTVEQQTMEVLHEYEGYGLTLAVYRCVSDPDVEPEAVRVHDIAWVKPEAFADYPFPGADQQTVDLLVASLE
jgi:8-oxo-dGTP diphosphatase